MRIAMPSTNISKWKAGDSHNKNGEINLFDFVENTVVLSCSITSYSDFLQF